MFGPFGAPQQPFGGFGYQNQAPVQPPVFNQLLNADQISKLQKAPSQFTTRLTEDEYLRAICTHKDLNNHITLDFNSSTGKYRCSVCGAEFYLVDVNESKENIDQSCYNFYDLLQTIKTYYGNVPESMSDLYLMLGFVKKVPQLWDIAKKYFEKATNQNGYLGYNNDQSGFNLVNTIFGNGALGGIPGMGGFGQNPYYAYQQQQQMPQQPQPEYYQQPHGYYQQPQQPMYAQTVPQQPGFQQPQFQQSANPIGYVPNDAQQAPMPAPPAPAAAQQQQPVAPAPMPAPPANPNLNTGDKADVTKQFT